MPFWSKKKQPKLPVDPMATKDTQPVASYSPPTPVANPELSGLVELLKRYPDGEIQVTVSTVADAKEAIEHLKRERKELELEQKQLAAETVEIQAEYEQIARKLDNATIWLEQYILQESANESKETDDPFGGKGGRG